MSKLPEPRPIEEAPKKNDVLGWCSVFPATEMDWRRIRYDGREWFIVGTRGDLVKDPNPFVQAGIVFLLFLAVAYFGGVL